MSNDDELRTLMQEVESAKNRFSNRFGYAPIQRQIGQWPRLSGTLLTDDLVDVSLMEAAVGDDFERLLELRRVAQKAFIEHNAKKTIQKIEHSRSRVSQEFTAGDYVFVYRVPKSRKRRVGGEEVVDKMTNKPYWVGPATVIMVDGANLWVTVFGQLWKVSREQCRLATNVEKQGIEVIMRDCRELVEEYTRRLRIELDSKTSPRSLVLKKKKEEISTDRIVSDHILQEKKKKKRTCSEGQRCRGEVLSIHPLSPLRHRRRGKQHLQRRKKEVTKSLRMETVTKCLKNLRQKCRTPGRYAGRRGGGRSAPRVQDLWEVHPRCRRPLNKYKNNTDDQ